jgi:photosystem II stability/assembly factor-like uncharacterized protein
MYKRNALFILLIIIAAVFYLSQNKKPSKISGAYRALEFWTRSRAYPQKDIAQKAFYAAFKNKEQRLAKLALSIDDSVSGWQDMGPYNVPGRMISVAVNPHNANTLYAGSASGGLWRTYHAATGLGWHRVTTGFPVLGVMAIAIDPVDTNNIFIGSGEVYGYNKSIGGTVIRTTRGTYGIGLLKSENGGKTWQKSLDWTEDQRRGIQCIEINPENPNSVYTATTEGVYKSVNAGKDWDLVLETLLAEDIIIHPRDTTKIMVSCGNLGSPGSGLYRSIDGGKSWDKLNGLPAYTGKTIIDVYQAHPDTVYASVADSISSIGLYKTEDFGSTWSIVHKADVQSYQGFYAHWVAVHPQDDMQVVHAGVNIYKSKTGGNNLSLINSPHVDHHNYAHDPQNPSTLYIACDGGIYRSINFGSSYTDIGYGLVTSQFYGGFSSSYQDSTLAFGGLQDNNTVITYGSKDWVRVIGGDGGWSAINALDDNILYGSWQYNNILKSTNRGQTFIAATNGMDQAGAAFIAPYVISESNPNVLYSGRTTIFKTINAADNWTATNNGSSFDGNSFLSMAVSLQNPNFVMAATAPTIARAHLYRTINGGKTWENITAKLPDRYPMDIAIDPNNDDIAYIVFNGFGSGHVFKTENKGLSWQDKSGSLPDVPTLAVAVDPANSEYIYIGNDLGVYLSKNGADSWEMYSKGLPEAVNAMELNISPVNRKLRLATHGNGAWQRPLAFRPDILLAYSFNSVANTILQGTPVYFAGSVSNFGQSLFADSVLIEIKVLDDGDRVLYAQQKHVCCIAAKSKSDFEFDVPFSAIESGDYYIHYITPAATTIQHINVIEPTSISRSVVSKEYISYSELSDPQNLPQGDDVNAQVILPFNFSYDGYVYNKVQISSNGWIELGTGKDGTERGLSTPKQIGTIGANQNGALASTNRPNKVLGPWWEDLNTDTGVKAGQVSYKVLGSLPNRTFVIQYKNMRAYFNAETTTRINFQVYLFEGNGQFEYHYGPVKQGTFSGGDIGAMIGFKDHIGGDYHFYDIIAGGAIPASDVVTNLSPLKDWPGPDSMFVIQTNAVSVIDEKTDLLPKSLSLEQNYPNPFNAETTIGYNLFKDSDVSLKVFDVLGREIKTLVSMYQRAGYRKAVWNGRNQQDDYVGSGIYFAILHVGQQRLSRKMILLK